MNTFTFSNGEKVEFPYEIDKTLIIDDVIIILLKSYQGIIFKENVYAYSKTGEFLWQIDKQEQYPDFCSFRGMGISKNNELVLSNFCSMTYWLNPTTGEVLRKMYSK